MCVSEAVSSETRDSKSQGDEYTDLIEEIYKLRYGNIKTEEPRVNVELSLPNMNNISAVQEYEMKKYLEEYLE
jgi:hypothetical protein